MACGLCSGLRTGRMAQTAQTFSDRPQILQRETRVCLSGFCCNAFHTPTHAHAPGVKTNLPAAPSHILTAFPSLLAPNFSFSHAGLPGGLQKETEFRFIQTFNTFLFCLLDFPGGSDSKASAYNAETRAQSLGWEDPLEKEVATHSGILTWKIPWMEEPGRLQTVE